MATFLKPLLLLLFAIALMQVSRAQQYKKESDDYKFASGVYHQVWRAFASKKQPPELRINDVPQSKLIARYFSSPGKAPYILINTNLVPFVKSQFKGQADAALACILGHELAHYFHGHEETDFVSERTSNAQWEFQADRSGFFYAYIAGYPSFSIAERLFKKLYEHYDVDIKNTGYRSLEERATIVKEQVALARKLAYTYEGGKLLLLINKPREAYECFKTVMAAIPAREVANNLGLSCLLRLIHENLITRAEMPFVLPFEPDVSNRLLTNSRGLTDREKALKDQLLAEAEHAFNEVYARGTYREASVNLAVCHLLMKNPNAAIGVINQMPKLSKEAILVRGVAYLSDGQNSRAADDFSAVAPATSALFGINSQIYREVLAQGWKDAGALKLDNRAKKVISLLPAEKIPVISDNGFEVVSKSPFQISLAKSPTGEVYKFLLPAPGSRDAERHDKWMVFKANPTGTNNVKSIKTGTSEIVLTGKTGYGQPDLVFTAGENFTYYFYKTPQIVFAVRNGKVAEWMIFGKFY